MKKIHQIYISDNNQPPSDYIKDKMKLLKSIYSDYEYKLYNLEECRDVVKSIFGVKCLTYFDSIKPYAFKADLARYTILYKEGGYYYDISIAPEYKFEASDPGVLYRSNNDEFTDNLDFIENNFMFFKEPKHPFLKDALSKAFNNIKRRDYGSHALSVTSPALLGTLDTRDIYIEETKKFNNEYVRFYKGKIHFYPKPIKYGVGLDKLGAKGTNNYEKMWVNKELYT